MNFHLAMPQTADRAYLVGGSVRDLLMGRVPRDYDVAVLEDPSSYARDLAAMYNSRVIELGRGDKCIFRVVGREAVFDVSRIKGACIEADLEARDFTINALARDLRSGDIVDVCGGRRDLADKIVRMVTATAFERDPVRLLRAYRIAAKTGFDIEARTAAAIAQNGRLIRRAAGERIRDEWFAFLECPVTAPHIGAMAAGGFVLALFPELKDLEGCLQNRHHASDAFVHSIETFGHLERLLRHPGEELPRSAAWIDAVLTPQRRAILKTAALLHDIGKPAAATTDDHGRRHFFGHEKTGATMIEHIARRYRFSNHERQTAAFIVRHHLRPLFLFNQDGKTGTIARARARFFMACETLVPDIMLHAVADSRGKSAQRTEKHAAFAAFADRLLESYFHGYRQQKKAPPLLNGRDLMRLFNLEPSPLIGRVLRRVEAARIAGQVDSREQAVHMAGTIIGLKLDNQQRFV